MSKLRKRMIQDMRLAGLVETDATRLSPGCSPAGRLSTWFPFPINLSERQVEKYILYVPR